jgi:hypothetical protein
MDNHKSDEEVHKVYSSYTPAQKKATLKYREQNKEKINTQRKEYYKKKVSDDPAFLEYKRKKAKEYYDRKKLLKDKSPLLVTPEPEPTPEVVEVKPEVTKPVKLKVTVPVKSDVTELVKPEMPDSVKPEVPEPVKKVKVKKVKEVIPDNIIDVNHEFVPPTIVDTPPIVVEAVDKKKKTKKV